MKAIESDLDWIPTSDSLTILKIFTWMLKIGFHLKKNKTFDQSYLAKKRIVVTWYAQESLTIFQC